MNRFITCWGLVILLLVIALAGCPRRSEQMAPMGGNVAMPTDENAAPTGALADAKVAAPTTAASSTPGVSETTTASASAEGGTVSSGKSGPDWPRFLGPNGDGTISQLTIKANWSQSPPQQLWQIPLTDNGYAGPAIAGGRVYIVDHQGQEDLVRCLNLADGKMVWTTNYPETGGDNYGFSRATPCLNGGKVFVVSRSGEVQCLKAQNGQKLWSRSLRSDFGGTPPQWNYAASPIVDDDKLIVIPGGSKGTVAALNPETGATIWQGGGTDIAGYATPVPATIGGVKQYVVFNGKALTGVQAKDGKLLWRVGWETRFDVNAATPIVSGNRIFITSGYGVGCGLVEVSNGKAHLVWRNKAIQAHFSSPLLFSGHIYGIGDPGNLVCLKLTDGKTVWQQSGFEKGGQILVGDTLLALQGANGALVQVKATPAGYQEMGRFTPLGGQSWTAPIVADGKLIVRNKTTLAAYALN